MIKKLLPIAALTTLAITQTLFPFVSTAENIHAKQSSVEYTNSKEDIDSISLTKTFGTPNFMSGKLSGSESSKESPVKTVLGFLNDSKHMYKLKKNPTESFKVIKQEKSNLGEQVVRFQQEYNGIKIFGYRQIAHIKNGILQSFSGSVAPEAVLEEGIKNGKKITEDEAINLARQDLKMNPKLTQTPTSELTIYMKEDKANLVYLVKLNFLEPEPGNWYYFIDVKTGKIVEKYNSIHEAGQDYGTKTTIIGKGVLGDTKSIIANKVENKYYLQDFTRGSGITTYDGQMNEILPGKIWFDDDGILNETYDAAAVDAHYNTAIAYDFYNKKFNLNSFDNRGASIKATVHVGKNYNNAYWDGFQFAFGDGDGKNFIPLSGAVDVVGHEFTHAVTQHTAELVYASEPGAINESISDIFGTLIEIDHKKRDNWQIGEDVFTPNRSGDALRSMSDPTLNENPDHYSNRYRGILDNGGVHINSGIPNKAAYLISEGGSHYGVNVKGIGKDKLGKIYYRALTNYLTPVADFVQLRLCVIQATKDLYGKNSPEVQTVENAFAAVGIYQKPDEKEIQKVKLNTPTSFEFKKEGESKWFKLDPHSAFGPNSHINFTIDGAPNGAGPLITVYRDKKSAEAGKAYFNYRENPNYLLYPLSNDSIIYIKVESTKGGKFTFNSEPMYHLPFNEPTGCVLEVSAKQNPSILSLLGRLRDIRDNMLQQTDIGQSISSLYYRISKEVLGDAILNSEFRNSVAKDLRELAGVIKEIQRISDGENSDYKLTKHEVEVMKHLKETVNKKASKKSVEQLNKYWDNLQLDEGKTLFETIKEFGLTTNSSNKIIVKVKKGVTLDLLKEVVQKSLTKLRLTETPKINALGNNVVSIENTFILEVKNNPGELVKQLKNEKIVEFVEVSKQTQALSNDTQYKTQWSLENTAQGAGMDQPIGGVVGADINYKEMVKFLRGKNLPDTVIAVLDTGVGYDFDDFKGVVLTDQDYDFVHNDDDAIDENGHGTQVASIIGAISNNKNSMTGINQHAKILPIQVLDTTGLGTFENLALGIRYATNHGAKVINISVGASTPSPVVEDALKYAVNKGVTIVAASGNEAASKLSYPASSDFVISVGSTDNSDAHSITSNTGEGLDLVAPGERIPSIFANGDVYYSYGTSMAAPHVAAVAGLFYSLKANIKVSEVKQALQESAHDLGDAGYDQKFGWGRLDAAAAVMKVGLKKIKPKPKQKHELQ
ncbi:M4 family metallopeptidase [Bacillus sp. AFS041924]|uniref:M4 family metallopeptidase n=1 Tax=Bacillus sp. AFS041924 TaxID=2033503 RepID=UPI000BFCCA63|nr:M4 family metallopeptidase [Bacillus sp. AFS041924]PGS51611.1 hypothetical protein COC46_11490 [Bacillus sp. AFS041924]